MREIKFRAWDILNNKFITHEQLMDLGFNVYKSMNTENTNWEYQQYTGHKDKNGVEIYERDILKVHSDSGEWCKYLNSKQDIVIVRFDEFRSGFSPFVDYDIDCDIYFSTNDCEVIGNIYQNKELLK